MPKKLFYRDPYTSSFTQKAMLEVSVRIPLSDPFDEDVVKDAVQALSARLHVALVEGDADELATLYAVKLPSGQTFAANCQPELEEHDEKELLARADFESFASDEDDVNCEDEDGAAGDVEPGSLFD